MDHVSGLAFASSVHEEALQKLASDRPSLLLVGLFRASIEQS